MIKRGILLFVGLSILFSFIISLISAMTMHPASSVVVNIDGTNRNLESGGGYFIGTHTYTSVSSLITEQHDVSQIWVSVKDGEMTLLNALKSTNKLCPKSTKPLTYSSLNIPNPSHLATEIQLVSGKSLQQAINDGVFCASYYWFANDWGSWSTTNQCSGYQTRTVYCKRSVDGANMGTKCGVYAGCECSNMPKTTQYRICKWYIGSPYVPECSWGSYSWCDRYQNTACSSPGQTTLCIYQSCGIFHLFQTKKYNVRCNQLIY